MSTKLTLLVISLVGGYTLSFKGYHIELGLYSYMFLAIALDFITGIAKSYVNKVKRTSTGYRRTVTKFLQYGGAILIGLLLKRTAQASSSEIIDPTILDFFNKSLISFIILIELTSVLENLLEVSPDGVFTKVILKPLYKLLTFSFTKTNIKDPSDSDTKA